MFINSSVVICTRLAILFAILIKVVYAKLNEFNDNGENQYIAIFNEIKKLYGSNGKIEFLTGALDTFEKHKNDMFECLKQGEKVFAVTTYASMGAGQNIHYEFPDEDRDKLVRINDFEFNHDKKDFDLLQTEELRIAAFYVLYFCKKLFPTMKCDKLIKTLGGIGKDCLGSVYDAESKTEFCWTKGIYERTGVYEREQYLRKM